MTKRDEQRRSGGGGRLLGLGALGGLVALAIAYFGNCIPGFGVGGSSAPSSTSKPAPSKAEPDAESSSAAGVKIVVEGERCRRVDEEGQACDALCRALAGGDEKQRIEIEGTQGTHAAVDGLRKCLGEQGFRDVVVRAE